MPNLPPLESRSSRSGRTIYLDYHASTPCDPRVVEAMLPFFLDCYANPSSATHQAGREAAAAVEEARAGVAGVLGAEPGEVVFTSGATESNNLSILGAAEFAPKGRNRVLASAIEHKSVLEAGKALTKSGFEFEIIPVDRDGLLDLGALSRLVDDRTLLVSVQAANNEIGAIQPVLEVTQIAHATGALVHCDAAQALGRIPMDVGDWGVDLLSISGHKCYGPKGVGALYVRGGARFAALGPLVFGGGQEHEIRPGTLNVPGIAGLGRACEIAQAVLQPEIIRVTRLRDRFESALMERLRDTTRNGALTRRLAGNSSLLIHGVDADALIANLPGVALSTGSACTSGAPEPSYVLQAIGLSREEAYSTIRVGIGRFSMQNELDDAASMICAAAEHIRQIQVPTCA